MKLLAAAIAAAVLGLPSAQASSPATVPGLVYTAGYGNSMVARYDPVTLERSGPRIRLGGNANSWGWSPRRRYLAVASYAQRLTVFEAATMRVVSRIRLAPGGGVARVVTWAGDHVLAVVEAPFGTVVAAVDPLGARVVRSTRLMRPFGYHLERLPEGLVFLLGARSRIGPVQLAVVDAEGVTRVVTVRQAAARAGLAVDPVGRRAYVVDGEHVLTVDLRTLAVSDPGPLRTLAKAPLGSERSARWLGNGLLAVSGLDRDAKTAKPAGLRLVDVRDWTSRTIDPTATSFTVAGRVLLVEERSSHRALNVTAYGFDGRRRYQRDLTGSWWMKKQGRLGYACRGLLLHTVIDLRTGNTVRSGFPARTPCPTLLVDDSRG